MFLQSRKAISPSTRSQNRNWINFQIFDQNHGQAPFEKYSFFNNFLNRCFQGLENSYFYLLGRGTLCFGLFCLKNWIRRNFIYFWQNLGQILWENKNFSTFLTRCSYSLETLFFPCTSSKNTLFWPIVLRNKNWRNFKFLTKTIAGAHALICEWKLFYDAKTMFKSTL